MVIKHKTQHTAPGMSVQIVSLMTDSATIDLQVEGDFTAAASFVKSLASLIKESTVEEVTTVSVYTSDMWKTGGANQ